MSVIMSHTMNMLTTEAYIRILLILQWAERNIGHKKLPFSEHCLLMATGGFTGGYEPAADMNRRRI